MSHCYKTAFFAIQSMSDVKKLSFFVEACVKRKRSGVVDIKIGIASQVQFFNPKVNLGNNYRRAHCCYVKQIFDSFVLVIRGKHTKGTKVLIVYHRKQTTLQ